MLTLLQYIKRKLILKLNTVITTSTESELTKIKEDMLAKFSKGKQSGGNMALITDQEKIQELVDEYTSTFPVDLLTLARKLGLRVFTTKSFKDSKSGEIVKISDDDYHIYLNAKHPYKRNRFTLAHEIAHYIHHREEMGSSDPLENYRNDTPKISLARTNGGSGKLEIEADHYGAALIMPEAEFIRVWNEKDLVDDVADHFDVSVSAADTRAKIISERQFTNGSIS